MRDTVHCSGLRLLVQIGFHPYERNQLQPVEVDLSIETDFRVGPERDEHQGLVDYERLATTLQERLGPRKFDLIEALAVQVARETLQLHPTARVRVKVTKRPPGLPQVQAVSVECVREGADFRA